MVVGIVIKGEKVEVTVSGTENVIMGGRWIVGRSVVVTTGKNSGRTNGRASSRS